MAYQSMVSLINLDRKTKEELLDMADVFFTVGRLNSKQYTEIVERINAK